MLVKLLVKLLFKLLVKASPVKSPATRQVMGQITGLITGQISGQIIVGQVAGHTPSNGSNSTASWDKRVFARWRPHRRSESPHRRPFAVDPSFDQLFGPSVWGGVRSNTANPPMTRDLYFDRWAGQRAYWSKSLLVKELTGQRADWSKS